MKREIKFKAWHKERQRFVFLKSIDFKWKEAEIDDEIKDIYSERVSLSDLSIVQFTGLHNKNGKEIWEGDVVHFLKKEWHPLILKGNHSVEGNMEVVFAEAWGSFGFKDAGAFYNYDYAAEIEVIGNIFENEELIKENL